MAILETKQIRKHFGGVTALDDGSFSLEKGEVHFLIGANGSGKSTLCKIVAGVVGPDDGAVFLRGERVRFTRPVEARRAGIGVVYQELSLIPQLSVARNIMLGMEPRTRCGFIARARLVARAQEMLALFGGKRAASMEPDTAVARLAPGQRQIVEILKVLAGDPEIVIFDEATSSLHTEQVKALFGLVSDLKRQGKAIVFISHRMEEVFEIGDRATVLRNGRAVGTVSLRETNRHAIVRMMVGHEIAARTERPGHDLDSAAVLGVSGLCAARIRDVSFELRKGEILGLGGLHGQGQSELLLCLFGVSPTRCGTVTLHGRAVRVRTPRAAMRRGLAYVSGDRTQRGVLLIRPVLENLALCLLHRLRRGVFARGRLGREVLPAADRLALVFGGLARPVNQLSGGNQQKVVLGKWLVTDPAILFMDDPTKGIDYHTKEELYALMRTMCVAGAAVIWHSSEDEELLSNCDRVLVFNGGRIVDELRGERMTELELYNAALRST